MKPRPLLPWIALACACRSVDVPDAAPSLAGLDEPVAFLAEPDDEAARQELDPGGFTGIRVGAAGRTLEALVGDASGLAVEEVVENSPAAAAGIEPGDLLLAARRPDGEELALEWPSQWRALELETPPGSELTLVLDRAGLELERSLTVVPRVAPAERDPAPRLREEHRVGIVLRAATEVEARAAGLAPGAGAVVVGLAAESPWRGRAGRPGLVYGDLITSAAGRAVDHPAVVLRAIEAAEPAERVALAVRRGGATLALELPVSRRKRELRDVSIPLVYRYRARGAHRTTSVLLGLVRYERSEVAWALRLFWLVELGGGDTDRLERIE